MAKDTGKKKRSPKKRQLRDCEGEVERLRQDVTHLTAQLTASQSGMPALADAVFDPILVVDAEHRIITINPAARSLFADKLQVIGQPLIAVTAHPELDALVDGVLEGEAALESQIEIENRSFRVRSGNINLSGQVGAVLMLQDISELLRLSRARRDMVANFSHDLRTPISSIRLLVETLSHNLGSNPERDARLIGKIAGEADSLQHITQELIDLSMIESGKAILRMVPVCLCQILSDAFNVMNTQVEQKKLEIVNRIPDTLEVLADPEQTRRVIVNIMHNAVKFTPSGGQIRFNSTRRGQMVTIRISDTGPGIPPKDRTRIFERFYQADAARTSTDGGSGLGLSIAKHIVEAQGGTIWVEGVEPQGACIAFTIPLADDPKACG
jgi:two-component system, OmpR family, phosphate regulon sensor histidine kinase PhoR